MIAAHPSMAHVAAWIPARTPPLNAAIVRTALGYVGIEEMPGGNRSGVIDRWNERAGSPLGSPWCASFVTAVWEDCGAAVPPRARASCDVLMAWAKRENLWMTTPDYGALVLYGVPGDASHVGIVARLTPTLCAVEGNTSFSGFSREGRAVVYKPVLRSRVLGYVYPRAA